MVSIGEMLRAAREAQGRRVADVATELCITERYLQALEDNDTQTLPGLFFYQSFVRQYAALLGIDAKQVNDALAATDGAVPPVATPETTPAFVSSRTFANPSPGAALLERTTDAVHRMSIGGYSAGLSSAALVAALVLGAGIFAWWNRSPQSPTAASVPARTAQGQAVGGALQNTATVTTPEDANEIVLSLSASEETWVSISSHGKVIFSGIMQPSESRTLKGGEVATMKIGNAGGVDIQLNGKSIGRVGPRGQVRTVRFTRQDFHVLSQEDLDATSDAAPHDL